MKKTGSRKYHWTVPLNMCAIYFIITIVWIKLVCFVHLWYMIYELNDLGLENLWIKYNVLFLHSSLLSLDLFQCCGSRMVFYGIWSSYKFVEFRIRIHSHYLSIFVNYIKTPRIQSKWRTYQLSAIFYFLLQYTKSRIYRPNIINNFFLFICSEKWTRYPPPPPC